MTWWAVALGALVGSPCRFLLDAVVSRRAGRAQPGGTLVINLSGSAILGVLAGLLARGVLASSGYALLGIGFCGSFTTFSIFVWETLTVVEDRRVRTAALNVILTVVLGIAFAAPPTWLQRRVRPLNWGSRSRGAEVVVRPA